MNFTVTARFQDRNQPPVTEHAETEQQAQAAAVSIARRFAALRSVVIDDHAARLQHLYTPEESRLRYQFTLRKLDLCSTTNPATA